MKVTDMHIGETRVFFDKTYIARKRVGGTCKECAFYTLDEICLNSVHTLGYCSIGREDKQDVIFLENKE